MKNPTKTILALFGAIILLGSTVQANTITLGYVSTTYAGGGLWNWNYQVSFANSELDNSLGVRDFFTINDFGAVQGFTWTPAGPIPTGFGTPVQLLIGTNVPGLLATIGYTDNPSVLNATFSWHGPNHTIVGAATFLLTLQSYHGAVDIGAYNSSDHSVFPPDRVSHAVGFLEVPTSAPDGGSAVALLGIALAGVEGVRRMFRARKT
jgi:VPDSG-CTERM motif